MIRDYLSNLIDPLLNPLGALPGSNRSFKLHKRAHLFIRVHNETLSVAVSVENETSVNRLTDS
jgi:hypothetical protein